MKKVDLKKVKEASELKDEMLCLQSRYISALKKAFPVGSKVTFQKGRGLITAEIIEASDRMHIRNMETGKKYWIDAYWIMKEYEGKE